MIVKIISIGTEILLGEITNTNAQYLAKQIANLGFSSYFQTVVGDNPERMNATIKNSLEHSDILIMTGGLGPTYDDVSKEIVASVMGLDLILDETVLKGIQAFFSVKGEDMPDNNKRQAMIPEGALVLNNTRGTAPGIIVEQNKKIVILLPGPPHEMKAMFEKSVTPYLSNLSDNKIVSSHLYLFGIGESEAERQLKNMMEKYTNPTIAPYASSNVLMIRVTARAKTVEDARSLIDPVLKKIAGKFKDNVFSIDEPSLENVVVEKLLKHKLTLATAESCTGGLLSEMITRVPGVSEVYDSGYITYSNASKVRLLNVSEETLKDHGAVSMETANEMAEHVRSISGSDFGISISGLAGPGGGSDEKPVGLVYVSLATKEETVSKKLLLGRNRINDRERIRQLASMHALKLLLDFVKAHEE